MWNNIEQWKILATQLTAIGAFLYGFYKYIGKPLFKFVKNINNISSEMGKSLPILMKIASEFEPNHGGSLKDVIDSIKDDLAMSKSRNRAILSFFDISYYESDPKGQCIFISKKYSQLCGLDFDEAKGKGWINMIKNSQRELVMEAWEIAILEKREFDMNYTIINSENKEIQVKCHAYPVKSTSLDNHIVGYIGILTVLDK